MDFAVVAGDGGVRYFHGVILLAANGVAADLEVVGPTGHTLI